MPDQEVSPLPRLVATIPKKLLSDIPKNPSPRLTEEDDEANCSIQSDDDLNPSMPQAGKLNVTD